MHDIFDYGEGWPGEIGVPKKITSSDVRIFDQLQERKKWTPDFAKLRKYNWVPVFVYDDFRQKGAYNKIFNDSKYLGHGVTCTDLYTMRGHRMALAFDNNFTGSPLRGALRGEVYAVHPDTIQRLDKIKANGIMFNRIHRHVFLPDQDYKTSTGYKSPSIGAWMYIADDDFWTNNHLPALPLNKIAGSPKKYYDYVPNTSPYALSESESYRKYMTNRHMRQYPELYPELAREDLDRQGFW